MSTLASDRMLENGLWAVGALTIGLGVFPTIAGLAALVRPRQERWTPELRAVVATCGALIFGFTWYTAVKARSSRRRSRRWWSNGT